MTVGAGTATRRASDEVELDIETAITSAPGLDGVKVYVARPNGTMSAVVNTIVADAPSTGVRIISDSWGLCEPALSPARAAATSAALQLAAVSGSPSWPPPAIPAPTTAPASGAGGGCSRRAAVRHRRRWHRPAPACRRRRSRGGLERHLRSRRWWPFPVLAAPVLADGCRCHQPVSTGARQVPDISLHASPAEHGYPILLHHRGVRRRRVDDRGRNSASAPLLAGIVADMNTYSRAHGGQRLGYANPFLRRFAAHPAAFRDVTRGDNNPISPGPYPATAGYDLASGIGTPRPAALAVDLAGYVPVAPNPVVTQLTALPARDQVVRYGHAVVLHGRLSDAGGPIAGARVVVQGGDLSASGSGASAPMHPAAGADAGPPAGAKDALARRLPGHAASPAGGVAQTGAVHRPAAVCPSPPTLFPPDSRSGSAGDAGRAAGPPGCRRGAPWPRPLAAAGPGRRRPERQLRRTVRLDRPGRYQLRWHYHGGRTASDDRAFAASFGGRGLRIRSRR